MKKIIYAIFLVLCFTSAVSPHAFAQFKKNKNKNKVKAITESDLQKAEYYFLEGGRYFILEDFSKALVHFHKSMEINPDNAANYFKIAETYTKVNELDKAIVFAKKAYDLEPRNKYYYLLAAEICTRQANFKEAAKIYEALFKKVPDSEDHLLDLATIYLYQNALDDAIKTLNKAEKKFGIQEEISLQKQKIYLSQNKLKEAILETEALIKENPGESKYILMLTQILVANNKASDATPYLEELLIYEPDNARVRLMLSEIYRQDGKEELANKNLELAFASTKLELQPKLQVLTSFMTRLENEKDKNLAYNLAQTLIKAHPFEAESYAMYGDLLYFSNEKNKAREQYLKAVAVNQSLNYNIWQNILYIDVENNELDSALVHSEKALEVYPNQSMFYYFNGMANLGKKNYKAAVHSLEQGKKLASSNPNLVSIFNSLLGDAYNGVEKHDKSDAAYEAALEFDPENAHVLNNYSYFLSLRKEKLDQARKMSEKLIKKHPDNPTFLDTYAWVLYMQGEYQEAKKYLEKALADESNGTIIEHYGDVLYKLGEKEEALKQWKKAKELGETSEFIDKKIADKKLYE
jgi:tetratricopeptide (TPR) repeat protein